MDFRSRFLGQASLATAVFAAAVFLAVPAKANTVFDFSFTDSAGDIASGVLDVTGSGFPFTVTSISGLWDGHAITGLDPYAAADQLLYGPLPPNADVGGISFDVATGLIVNWSDFESGTFPLGSLALSTLDPPGNGCCQIGLTSVTLTQLAQTPLPSTWTMLIAGFVGLGFLAFRSTQKRPAALAAA
jgi:hypothetical protein